MKPESLEKKLHIGRDVEGNPNIKGIETIRELEREMNKYKSFVGLASFGSTLSGYGSKESDVDIFILYDKPDGNAANESDYDELWPRAFEWQEEMHKKGIKVDFRLQNINLDNLIKSMKNWIKERGNLGEYVPESLEAMTRVVTGKKIEGYRKELVTKLNELSLEQRRIIADELMKSLLKRDQLSLSKRERRMQELSREEHRKILDERQKMWRDRVQKIWGL